MSCLLYNTSDYHSITNSIIITGQKIATDSLGVMSLSKTHSENHNVWKLCVKDYQHCFPLFFVATELTHHYRVGRLYM